MAARTMAGLRHVAQAMTKQTPCRWVTDLLGLPPSKPATKVFQRTNNYFCNPKKHADPDLRQICRIWVCVSLDCCHTGLPQAKHRLKRIQKPKEEKAEDPEAEAGPGDSDEGPPTDIEVASLEMNSFLFSGTPVFVMSKTQKFRNFRTAEKKTRFNPEARAGCPRLSPGRPGRASGLKPYFFFS